MSSSLFQQQQLQPTGSFVYESPLSAGRRYSSQPPRPLHTLASLAARQMFGEHVQRVVDGLSAIGACRTAVSLKALHVYMQRQEQRVTTMTTTTTPLSTMSSSSNNHTQKMEHATIRAALLVLLQHSIVTCVADTKDNTTIAYRYHPERAARLAGGTRYARYVDFTKRFVATDDAVSASVVELLLLRGQMRTVDLVVASVVAQQQENDNDNAPSSHYRYTARETVVDALAKLVRQGYVEKVPSMLGTMDPKDKDDVDDKDPNEGEREFGDDDENEDDDDANKKKKTNKKSTKKKPASSSLKKTNSKRSSSSGRQGSNASSSSLPPPPTKRVKLSLGEDAKTETSAEKASQLLSDEDPAVVELLHHHAHYKATLPVDAVWRVNQDMFHQSLVALRLGRLVAELYNSKVRYSGSLVTAALKYKASLEHGAAGQRKVPSTDTAFFAPRDVIKFLPKTVVQNLESEASSNDTSGPAAVPSSSAAAAASSTNNNNNLLVSILQKSFGDLAQQTHPATAVRRVGDDMFEIATSSLLDYLRRRIVHQVVHDRHGQVAARILVILQQQGWLESDTLATAAMVPAKDTRGLLHELYRSRYVDLVQLSTSQSSKLHYNPGSALYLWCVHPDRLRQKVLEDTLLAVRNVQLRRQHEAQVVGREWIERAQRQAPEEENEHEDDKLRYQKFCLGLERLDVELQNLDETLLMLQSS